MDNFDLRKYLTEGRLFENDNVKKVEHIAMAILTNVLQPFPTLDDTRVLDDELDYQRYESDEWEEDNLSDKDWDLVKQMLYWALDEHGPKTLYISLVDDINYDIVDDWDLELDKFNNYKDTIDYWNIFKGFKPK